MKRQMFNILSACAFTLMLAACAKSNNGTAASTPSTTTPTTTAATCQSGYLNSTQYGCQPQCGTSSVIYNGQCVVVTLATTSSATTCQSGYLNSTQYGCQPQCGTSSVWYNNQCTQVTVTSNSGSCAGSCPAGNVQVQGQCLPQGICRTGFGYGYDNSGRPYCYTGDLWASCGGQ